MTKIFLITAASYLFFSYNATGQENSGNDTLQKDSIAKTRIKQLKRAFVHKDYTSFFKLFPDTYSELTNFYGFDDSKGESPLYPLYDAHISYLFDYKEKINLEMFAKKVYEVAKGGAWDADAVGLFQSRLSNLIINHPNVFLEILNTKPDKEAASFWCFVLDGPHPNNDQNKEFIASLSKQFSENNKQILLLKTQFERMKVNEVH